jgi:hypothetical protein
MADVLLPKRSLTTILKRAGRIERAAYAVVRATTPGGALVKLRKALERNDDKAQKRNAYMRAWRAKKAALNG